MALYRVKVITWFETKLIPERQSTAFKFWNSECLNNIWNIYSTRNILFTDEAHRHFFMFFPLSSKLCIWRIDWSREGCSGQCWSSVTLQGLSAWQALPKASSLRRDQPWTPGSWRNACSSNDFYCLFASLKFSLTSPWIVAIWKFGLFW